MLFLTTGQEFDFQRNCLLIQLYCKSESQPASDKQIIIWTKSYQTLLVCWKLRALFISTMNIGSTLSGYKVL